MKAKNSGVALVVVFALGFVGASAWAQQIDMKVSHKFMVGKQEFPAGEYQIKYDGAEQNRLVLRSVHDAKLNATIPVITRLSSREGSQPMVVFDKVGDVAYLSEVYMLDIDGFHLQGAPGPHTHEKVVAVK